MLRFTAIVVGLIAVLFGLPTLAATVQPVATVEPVAGKVSLNRGQGFKEVTGRAQANAGDQVMVNPGGRAKIVYLEGCMVDVRPGAVVGIAGSCKVAMAKPMTAGLEPVVAAPVAFPWGAAVLGTALAVGVACIGFCQNEEDHRHHEGQAAGRHGSKYAQASHHVGAASGREFPPRLNCQEAIGELRSLRDLCKVKCSLTIEDTV